MKKLNLTPLMIAVIVGLLAFSDARAQQDEPTVPPPDNQAAANKRPRLLEALGLTREQLRQIRQINQTRRPFMQQAQRAWREAQRRLDQAIYADVPNEEEIKARLREAQAAHGEFLKARSETEFLIRRVLTPEQLQKFRELRERANNLIGNPNNRRLRPINRFPRRQQPE